MMNAGIGLAATGLASAAVGGVFFGLSTIDEPLIDWGWGSEPSKKDFERSSDRNRDRGAGFLIGAGILGAVGIPLAIVGSRRVPVESMQLVPALGGAGIRGTF